SLRLATRGPARTPILWRVQAKNTASSGASPLLDARREPLPAFLVRSNLAPHLMPQRSSDWDPESDSADHASQEGYHAHRPAGSASVRGDVTSIPGSGERRRRVF